MRNLRTAILGGIAAISLAGFVGTAAAQSPDTHVMTVRMPGGGIAEIRYTGNVPPQLVFTQGPAALTGFDPLPAFFGPDSPFATMQRISAEMNRQAAAMFAEANSLAARAQSGKLTEAALRAMPPGTQSYSLVSTISGNGVCTRSVEITSIGNGAAPKVVSHSSGSCGTAAGAGGRAPVGLPVARPAVPATRGPDLILTKANQPRPYGGLVRRVADAQR